MFEYRKGILFWNDFDLSTLREQFSSPLHVIHNEAVQRSIDQFLKPFKKENLPIACHYSVKTNPVPELLLLFKQYNVDMEVISEYEMWLVEQLGFQGSNIIINGPGKSKELLSMATKRKVKMVSLWSLSEFQRSEEISFEESEPLNIGIRICPSFSPRLFNLSLNSARKNSPHGFHPKESVLKQILQKIKNNHNLNFIGFHIHLGSGIDKNRPYIKALSLLEELIIDAGKHGLKSKIINIGGGFGSGSAPLYTLPQLISTFFMKKNWESDSQDKPFILEPLAKELSKCLARLHKLGYSIEEVITEPGRILSGPSQITILTVLDIIKHQKYRPALICDGGAMSLSPMLLTEYHRIFPLIKRGDKMNKYSVYGNLPSSFDMVSCSVYLPEIKIGDQVAVLDTGAYFIPFSNNFAGPRPAIVMIEGNRSRFIRQNESRIDLIRHDVYFNNKIWKDLPDESKRDQFNII